MKKIVSLIVLSSCFLLSQAQPLRSQGPVPADLLMSVEQLYDSDIQRAEIYAGGRVRDKQAILEASYRINKMLAGGHIVYGDPITGLINRIADTLLRDYPDLRSELRFYTVTSPDVNAFTTPQGMIFVNAGLVAQAENEAQLAFIIAHEIIHYYRAHGLETLVGKDGKKKRGENLDDEAEHAGDFTRKHIRSHEMENESDSLGIALFYLNSPYWKDVTEGVFDVLQYSYLPFDEVPFDTTFFNTQYYRLTGCWLDTVADITSRDNYDDSRSTHPNILSRRQRTANALAGHAGGQKYLMVSQEEFDSLRHIARVECIRQDLLHGNYPRAFYNSWLLHRCHSDDDPTINRYLTQALYGIAVFKCNERESEVLGDYTKMEGEIQQVYYAFKQMNAEQATLAALSRVWREHRLHPRDAHYDAMFHHLMELLRTKCHKSATDYLPTPPVASTDTVAATDSTQASNKPLTKYERIKQKRQTQTRQNPTAYALTAFMEADSTLYPTLVTHLNGNTETPQTLQPTKKDAMLVFNPSYWVADKHDNLRAAESDACEGDLVSRITGTAKHLGIRTVDFSDQGMHAMTSDAQYNNFLTVCEWMNEFWLTRGLFDHCRLSQSDMDRLLARYDARTLNMTAILNVEGLKGEGWATYAIIVPLAPVAVTAALTGIESTTMVSIVVDAHEGKMLTRQAYHYNVADHPALLNAMLYDTYVRTIPGRKDKEPVGHLGHRFALAGGFNFGMPGYQNFKQHQYVAFTPWASAEFALTRRLSLAVTARHQKGDPNITMNLGDWKEYTYRDSYGHEHYESRWVDSIAQTSRNMLTIGLELRSYKNTDFAPYGYYFDIGAHMTRMTTIDKQTSNNTFGVHVGLGRNYIFFNRLLLNYQIDYGYTYGFVKSVFGFEEETRPNRHYADAILSNIFTFKLGIGFLPF
ncbi:MAG: M48 family metalloprotease [Bacteroidales bacterium]|nr:M48 family metalloprotease [Bacteroidales bacterium]